MTSKGAKIPASDSAQQAQSGDSAAADPNPEQQQSVHERPARKKHVVRWLALCVAGSATVTSLMLAIALRQDLPLEFASTFALAILGGAGLPILVVMIAGRRLKNLSVDRTLTWCLTCLILIVLAVVMLAL